MMSTEVVEASPLDEIPTFHEGETPADNDDHTTSGRNEATLVRLHFPTSDQNANTTANNSQLSSAITSSPVAPSSTSSNTLNIVNISQCAGLNAALIDILKATQSSSSSSASFPIQLSDTFHLLTSSLTFDQRSQFFAAASKSSQVYHAMREYLLDQRTGSATDGVCKWLYDAYWEASTKLPPSATSASIRGKQLPPAHLFLIQFIPVIIQRLLPYQAHRRSPAQSAPSSLSSASSWSGLFTVGLSIYNTERILSARHPESSILAPGSVSSSYGAIDPKVSDWLKTLPATDLSGRSHQDSQSDLTQRGTLILPSLTEPSSHFNLFTHVLLKKVADHVDQLQPAAIHQAIYLILTSCQAGHQNLDEERSYKIPEWLASSSRSTSALPRLTLRMEVLHDCIQLIAFALDSRVDAIHSERHLALMALRELHARAIEDMRPAILLQTTVMLEQEERKRQ